MNEVCVLMFMFLLHVIEDFKIQGIMAEMKQKKFWSQYGEKYRFDWLPPLLWHGFEWSMFISFPLIWMCDFNISAIMFVAILTNGLVHSFIDSEKCNRFRINLIDDQLAHVIQILAMYGLWLAGVF